MKKSVKFIICCLGLSVALIASGLLAMWDTDAPKQPKYVFYFIGDGMSFNHILGTEQYNAVKEGKSEIERLNFSQFESRNFVTN